MDESEYYVEYDGIASMGRFVWKVKQRNTTGVIAHCEVKEFADKVVSALNFNRKPSDYGYVMSKDF